MIDNMNTEEIRAALGIGKTKLYELINDPDFPSFRIGNRIFVNRRDLEEWQRRQIDLFKKEKEATGRG